MLTIGPTCPNDVAGALATPYVESITAPDEETIVIQLKSAVGFFSQILAGAPYVPSHPDIFKADECVLFPEAPIYGVGPWFISQYTQGEQVVLPEITSGAFSVSGTSSLMRDWEIVQNIAQLVLPLFDSPVFQPYTKPYQLCLAIEKRLNLEDEGLFVDAKTAQQVDEAQQAAQEQVIGDEAMQSAAMTEQMQREAMSTPTSPEEAEGLPPTPQVPEGVQELPSYAGGGYIPEGQPAIVGEEGAELFVPLRSGAILNPTQVRNALDSLAEAEPVRPNVFDDVALGGKG